ncbi:hypothetical protein SAMN05421776_11492 [Nocardia farcinica]|uniref:Uncharacterized protein n=1 Tax=Nocardia farcinica TaxID=37329 RepID=A0A0H5NQK7_NOCFR|nr:hypothetical protein [Nocardia farcinica]AXK85728.1 hypothetical protein DXT66_08875 [Nocardia farcinica]PFW99248.1 hypothetical protein CJ469_05511 [Nocardia farcinica]CRY77587.1 Uncharacterised protein [Nocardia farcinica]SIT33130.1 hypothetical protein SAMN05421776_11492 [Nocardia farcinica]
MALKDVWFTPDFHEAFPKGLFLLGEIEPVIEFNKDRNAPKIQKQELDADGNGTGRRLWKGTVTDPDAPNAKSASYDVIFASPHQPVPAVAEIVPGMTPIELEGLEIKPKIQGSGEFKSIGWMIRAAGIKGDTSGAKQAPADPGAGRPSSGKAA